jgi:hypothetical protein
LCVEENASSVSNVKLDLGACPESHKEAATALLETVKSVLGGALKTDVLTLNANFYQLGGNSLNSIFTITKLRDQGFNIGKFKKVIFIVVFMHVLNFF